MSNAKNATSLDQLTEAQRKSLAASIVKARESKQPWDGENGIVNDDRFPLIKSAGQGRKLLSEAGKASMIAKSYDRAAKGLVGPRVSDAKPKAKTAPKSTARKAPAKKAAATVPNRTKAGRSAAKAK